MPSILVSGPLRARKVSGAPTRFLKKLAHFARMPSLRLLVLHAGHGVMEILDWHMKRGTKLVQARRASNPPRGGVVYVVCILNDGK